MQVKGLVLVWKEVYVVQQGSLATNAYIVTHANFPGKTLYATIRRVKLTTEDPDKNFFVPAGGVGDAGAVGQDLMGALSAGGGSEPPGPTENKPE